EGLRPRRARLPLSDPLRGLEARQRRVPAAADPERLGATLHRRSAAARI
ncbi:MAG: Mercuric ion reductase, partial [uncultured Microvirga sp.]